MENDVARYEAMVRAKARLGKRYGIEDLGLEDAVKLFIERYPRDIDPRDEAIFTHYAVADAERAVVEAWGRGLDTEPNKLGSYHKVYGSIAANLAKGSELMWPDGKPDPAFFEGSPSALAYWDMRIAKEVWGRDVSSDPTGKILTDYPERQRGVARFLHETRSGERGSLAEAFEYAKTGYMADTAALRSERQVAVPPNKPNNNGSNNPLGGPELFPDSEPKPELPRRIYLEPDRPKHIRLNFTRRMADEPEVSEDVGLELGE